MCVCVSRAILRQIAKQPLALLRPLLFFFLARDVCIYLGVGLLLVFPVRNAGRGLLPEDLCHI